MVEGGTQGIEGPCKRVWGPTHSMGIIWGPINLLYSPHRNPQRGYKDDIGSVEGDI